MCLEAEVNGNQAGNAAEGIPTEIPYSFKGSSFSSKTSSSSSSSAPPGRSFLTLLPSIHSIPKIPSEASTIRTPGTFTPDLWHPTSISLPCPRGAQDGGHQSSTYRRHFNSALASPATRDRVNNASNDGCLYCFLKRYFSKMKGASGTKDPL